MRVSQVEFAGIVADQVSLQRHPSVKEQRANDVRNEDWQWLGPLRPCPDIQDSLIPQPKSSSQLPFAIWYHRFRRYMQCWYRGPQLLQVSCKDAIRQSSRSNSFCVSPHQLLMYQVTMYIVLARNAAKWGRTACRDRRVAYPIDVSSLGMMTSCLA